MSNKSSPFIKMDLDFLRTMSDIDSFFDYHGIPDGIWSKRWILENVDHVKFWVIDGKTFIPICCVIRAEPTKIYLDDSFTKYLFDLGAHNPSVDVKNMTLDSILDKVSEVGFDGLTQLEKNFLLNQSGSI